MLDSVVVAVVGIGWNHAFRMIPLLLAEKEDIAIVQVGKHC